MSDEHEVHGHDDHDHDEHDHDHHGHDHGHEHDHDHEHEHDHALIVDRLPEGAWRVDPDGSEVLFRGRSLFGLLPVNGIFNRFSGELNVDAAGTAVGTLTVEPGSITTGIEKRDTHLKSADFFDVKSYPTFTFTLVTIEPSGHDHLNLTGALELAGKRIPLSFPIYAIAHGDHLHLEGRTIVDHAAAGLKWSRPGMVGKKIKVGAALTLIRA